MLSIAMIVWIGRSGTIKLSFKLSEFTHFGYNLSELDESAVNIS